MLNTMLMGLIVLLILIFMMHISGFVVETSSVNQLKKIVHENVEDMEWKRGELDIDELELFENHISTLVYDRQGNHLAGFEYDHKHFWQYPLTHKQVTDVNVGGVDYLLYDFLVEDSRNQDIFLRGVVSVSEISDTVNLLFYFTLFALPMFILCSAGGSYVITKKSMKPLEKIIQTAEEITHGEDLSMRIDLGKGKDEIHHLANTFDVMFGKLEKAFLSEKQFTSDVSHELRTPTAVILAECEMQLEHETTQEEKNDSFANILRQGQRMQQLISGLLNLIRLDNGVQKLSMTEEDFSELVFIICEEQEAVLPETCRLETTISPEIMLEMDYTLMIRVLSNLIDNGIKYGKEGGTLTVSLTEEEDTVLLAVSDDGIGIAQEHLERIFSRFYQVDGARTVDRSESMGLGLSMVEQIVKLHHGSIEVESEVGVGTTFFVKFLKK